MNPEQQQQRIMAYFIEEAKEHLQTIEQGVLNLQETLTEPEMVNDVFRAAHSIKGGAAMLGVSSVQHISHRLEDYFKILQENTNIDVDEKLKTLFLASFDRLQELLENLEQNFRITDELATTSIARVEPVFAELEVHLHDLVAASAGKLDSSVKVKKVTGRDLSVVFQSEITNKLRDMLQLFKQSDGTLTRQQLQDICHEFRQVGEEFNLPNWCELIQSAAQAIANQENSYSTLAPVLIKDIKQAKDLVLALRGEEIAVSIQLQTLLPEVDDNLIDDLSQPIEIAADDDESAIIMAVSDEVLAEQEYQDTSGISSEISEKEFFGNDNLEWLEEAGDSQNLSGPEVGASELKSLASLFENEDIDLELAWEDIESNETLISNQANQSMQEQDEFADLFDDVSTSNGDGKTTSLNELSEDDGFDDLFGTPLNLDSTADILESNDDDLFPSLEMDTEGSDEFASLEQEQGGNLFEDTSLVSLESDIAELELDSSDWELSGIGAEIGSEIGSEELVLNLESSFDSEFSADIDTNSPALTESPDFGEDDLVSAIQDDTQSLINEVSESAIDDTTDGISISDDNVEIFELQDTDEYLNTLDIDDEFEEEVSVPGSEQSLNLASIKDISGNDISVKSDEELDPFAFGTEDEIVSLDSALDDIDPFNTTEESISTLEVDPFTIDNLDVVDLDLSGFMSEEESDTEMDPEVFFSSTVLENLDEMSSFDETITDDLSDDPLESLSDGITDASNLDSELIDATSQFGLDVSDFSTETHLSTDLTENVTDTETAQLVEEVSDQIIVNAEGLEPESLGANLSDLSERTSFPGELDEELSSLDDLPLEDIQTEPIAQLSDLEFDDSTEPELEIETLTGELELEEVDDFSGIEFFQQEEDTGGVDFTSLIASSDHLEPPKQSTDEQFGTSDHDVVNETAIASDVTTENQIDSPISDPISELVGNYESFEVVDDASSTDLEDIFEMSEIDAEFEFENAARDFKQEEDLSNTAFESVLESVSSDEIANEFIDEFAQAEVIDDESYDVDLANFVVESPDLEESLVGFEVIDEVALSLDQFAEDSEIGSEIVSEMAIEPETDEEDDLELADFFTTSGDDSSEPSVEAIVQTEIADLSQSQPLFDSSLEEQFGKTSAESAIQEVVEEVVEGDNDLELADFFTEETVVTEAIADISSDSDFGTVNVTEQDSDDLELDNFFAEEAEAIADISLDSDFGAVDVTEQDSDDVELDNFFAEEAEAIADISLDSDFGAVDVTEQDSGDVELDNFFAEAIDDSSSDFVTDEFGELETEAASISYLGELSEDAAELIGNYEIETDEIEETDYLPQADSQFAFIPDEEIVQDQEIDGVDLDVFFSEVSSTELAESALDDREVGVIDLYGEDTDEFLAESSDLSDLTDTSSYSDQVESELTTELDTEDLETEHEFAMTDAIADLGDMFSEEAVDDSEVTVQMFSGDLDSDLALGDEEIVSNADNLIDLPDLNEGMVIDETVNLLSEEMPASASTTIDNLVDFFEGDEGSDYEFGALDESLNEYVGSNLTSNELEGAIADAEVSNNFDDLDAMLEDSSPPADSGTNLAVAAAAAAAMTVVANNVTNNIDTPDSSFDDLDALLGDDTPPPPLAVPPAQASQKVVDEFSDLDSMLQDLYPEVGSITSPRPAKRLPDKKRRDTKIVSQTMKVDVKHLDSLNNLVGELVVNRNLLEQDQERLQQFISNLLHQVQLLSDVSQRMRDQYDRSLLENSLLASRNQTSYGLLDSMDNPDNVGEEFDALEMDRFSSFHALSQEIIELIVRVRESASDIEFVVGETEQVSRQLGAITTQIQDDLKQSRMVPFAQIADRLPRAVRDLALEEGKQVDIEIFGRETLIDKAVLDELNTPMNHLITNAIAHGIEDPATRQASGKTARGKITIRAYHQGNQTVISINDDGGGINADRVKQAAVNKGLLNQAEAAKLSDPDVYELLFMPGFSTKAQADQRSGRGMGLDIVKTDLAEIRGTVHTESALVKGTTFTIRLPLTLSISKAMFCVSDRTRVAFPVDGFEDVIEIPQNQLQLNSKGQPCIPWRDMILPFQPLSNLLSYNRHIGRGNIYGKQDDDTVSIIVLRNEGSYLALQVDQFQGESEIVIKQLEGPIPKPAGIAGATVLGDGRVMAIANVLELFDIASGRLRPNISSPPDKPTVEEKVKTDPTVLIVDDSITVRELLSLTFAKVGYRVEQARDGQDAWEKLRAGLPCDLIFCDIEMPRMDGLELLSRLQKDESLSKIPIAMLTSRGADRHRQTAVQLGASGYFTKPYLEEELLTASQRMLKGEVLVTLN
jgi:chemotaxis protein histidine kinase CheA/ActR/RegA family two-component response regulator